ncbi:AAA family ATPase [Sedimenticola thiotaurini]|uniref:ATPase AAA n=1 Tax=Sedimenticola thiotaurini TaxID=1543721 RepID=A0A0F7JX91_9GAMM|nr:MoxR family ATPase [Sedimenticola thiotaurini]AKH21121.1 ATPase AAA [Sedimenticola thiotaurini]
MKQLLDQAVAQAGKIIVGKEHTIRLALTCLLANGHLLIEDLPGVGKTTLAHTLARLLGLQYQRIQFTSDLLPADIIGVSIYNRGDESFQFHPGPVFSQLLLADEINRATPKAQSALLEAMEERQVTSDGQTRNLPQPFFVIATQNPAHQVGTFPLPESQLDRFLMRIQIGYPDAQAERVLLAGEDRRNLLEQLAPCLTLEQLRELQQQVTRVHVSNALLDYIQALLKFSRSSPRFQHGLSPRAGLALINSARAWALLAGHPQVLPEDVQAVLAATVTHRLQGGGDGGMAEERGLAQYLLESVPLP